MCKQSLVPRKFWNDAVWLCNRFGLVWFLLVRLGGHAVLHLGGDTVFNSCHMQRATISVSSTPSVPCFSFHNHNLTITTFFPILVCSSGRLHDWWSILASGKSCWWVSSMSAGMQRSVRSFFRFKVLSATTCNSLWLRSGEPPKVPVNLRDAEQYCFRLWDSVCDLLCLLVRKVWRN